MQKALDAANKLIDELKARIESLTVELLHYRSIRSKLNPSELERENTEL